MPVTRSATSWTKPATCDTRAAVALMTMMLDDYGKVGVRHKMCRFYVIEKLRARLIACLTRVF